MSEKRTTRRIAYACEVECSGVGMGVSPPNPRISDLSASGAFVECVTQIPAGARIRVTFDLRGRAVSSSAEVAHCMPGFGMGIRFANLGDEERAAIESLVTAS